MMGFKSLKKVKLKRHAKHLGWENVAINHDKSELNNHFISEFGSKVLILTGSSVHDSKSMIPNI